MNNDFKVKFGSVIFDRLNTVHLSEQERLAAMNAMLDADAIVERCTWIVNKIEQLGAFLFMRPGIKH